MCEYARQSNNRNEDIKKYTIKTDMQVLTWDRCDWGKTAYIVHSKINCDHRKINIVDGIELDLNTRDAVRWIYNLLSLKHSSAQIKEEA